MDKYQRRCRRGDATKGGATEEEKEGAGGQGTGKAKSENYSQRFGSTIKCAFPNTFFLFILSHVRLGIIKLEFSVLFTEARVYLKNCFIMSKTNI